MDERDKELQELRRLLEKIEDKCLKNGKGIMCDDCSIEGCTYQHEDSGCCANGVCDISWED